MKLNRPKEVSKFESSNEQMTRMIYHFFFKRWKKFILGTKTYFILWNKSNGKKNV